MCFYINITCPGNCGTLVASNNLVAACKLSTVQPRPYNFDQVHSSEHELVPLLPSQVQSTLAPGYACTEPSCSYHPDAATTTLDLSPIFRCPGCGTVHSRNNGVWIETWIARNGILVPYLDKSQWSEFTCTQKNLCHFNPDFAQGILDKVNAAEMAMFNNDVLFDAVLLDDQIYLDDDQDVQDVQNDQHNDNGQPALDDDPVVIHVQNGEGAGQNSQASSKPKSKQTVPSSKRIRREPLKYQFILPKPANASGAA